MDTTLHAIFGDTGTAEQVARQLAVAGIDAQSIRLIAADPGHVGSFGDNGAHVHAAERDHVGSFGDNGAHVHAAERDHVGSFGDNGAHVHTAERDHVGSFGGSAPRITSDATYMDALAGAGLTAAEAQAYAARMSGASVVLVVRVAGDLAQRAREIIETARL